MTTKRVSLTYSVKIDKIESEVERLLNEALDNLEDTYANYGHITSGKGMLSYETISEIDLLRQELADIDLSLSGIHNIITAYLGYQAQALNEKPALPTDNVKQQLFELKNRLDNMSDENAD